MRHITLRDDKGLVDDQQGDKIFDALAEIDFAAIIQAKLDEHEIRAKGLTIEVDNGTILETQPN